MVPGQLCLYISSDLLNYQDIETKSSILAPDWSKDFFLIQVRIGILENHSRVMISPKKVKIENLMNYEDKLGIKLMSNGIDAMVIKYYICLNCRKKITKKQLK